MKKITFAVTALVLFSGVSVFASEQVEGVVIPNTPAISRINHTYEKEESMKTSSLVRLQSKGKSLINERITALSANLTSIESANKLTAEQKAALATLVTTNITGLNALAVKIASSTDATSTKVLVGSIFTNFRIYGIVIPQLRLEKRVYELQNHAGRLAEVFTKVQAKIDEAKGKGKDMTNLQKGLDDAKTLVASDALKLSALLTTLQALKPADYGTSSKAIIESANTELRAVAKDYQSITGMIHKKANEKKAGTMHEAGEGKEKGEGR